MTTLLWEDGDVVGSGGVLPADATTAAPRLHTKRARRRHWRRRLKLGGRHDANTQDSASDSASDSSAGTSLPPEVVALVAKLDHDPFNSQLLADLQSQIKRAGISMDDLARGSASSTAAAAARSLVDKRVKALGDVVGDAYADDVEDTRPETSESEHDPSEVPEHANRRRAAGGHLVKALRAAQPASALERALSRQAWLSALAVAEEFAMTVVAARFRSAVIDALGAAGTPGAQEILLRFILEAPGRTSEERHRAMLTLQQVRHPTNATILEVARRADCDTAAVDVAEAEECRLAIRVLGALVHKYDTSECAFAGRCAPNFTERIMSNVAHNLRRRRARFDEQGWPGRGGGRRLSMREASDSDEADLLSMIVSLGNAASSEHVDTILEIASFAGESNVRDAAIDALRKMDDPQVAPALWGFVHHSKDRPAQLRALRVLLDRDSDHHSGHLRLPSTRRAEDGAHRRRLQDEHAFNDIVGAYLDHASFGDQAEEVAKQIDRHLKVHSGRIKMDEPKHSRAHAKLKHRTTRRGEGRKPRGMKWTELPPAGAIAPAARAIDAAVVDPRRRQLGFVKDLSFSWSNGLNGELGFYEHKTIFELGNEEFGAEAYVTTDDIAYISLPLFGSLKFGVRVNNEAVIRLWANVAMISVDWKIFHAEYSYIKEQEISLGDFPLLPGGCPLDKKGSSRRRRLVGGRRVVGSNPSLPGAIVGDAEDAEAPAGRRRLEDDATDTASNEVFDQGSLNNIPDITAWKNVLSFRPNKAIQTALDEDKQYLQRIENGLEMVAVDYQAIKINTLPTGTSAHDLLDKLRRGEDQSGAFPALNAEAGTFHKPSLGYGRTWGEGDPTDATGNPTGFLGSRVTMKHELQCGKRRGDCDDGSLIVTEVKNDPDEYHFMLTTNNEDGDYNSATGNREIGIKKVGPDTFLYTRGAHRVTTQAIADVDYEEETEESSSGGGGRRLAGKPRMRAKWRKLMDGVTPPSEDSAGGGDPTGQQDVDNDGARKMAVKEEEEEEEGPRGWVQGEPHLGGRFLRHMEIAPGNWSHYSNESHPATGGRRILKYDASIHQHVISLDKAVDVIRQVNCHHSDNGQQAQGDLEIVLRPGLGGAEQVTIPSAQLRAIEKGSILVGHPGLWDCDFERSGGSNPILRRVVGDPVVRSVSTRDGRTELVLTVRTSKAKLTDVFRTLDVHLELHPPSGGREESERRRRRLQTLEGSRQRDNRRKLLARRLRAQPNMSERERRKLELAISCGLEAGFANADSTEAADKANEEWIFGQAELECGWGPELNINYKPCAQSSGQETNQCAAEKEIKFGKLGGSSNKYFGLCKNCYFW
jgi:hypothetical protein